MITKGLNLPGPWRVILKILLTAMGAWRKLERGDPFIHG